MEISRFARGLTLNALGSMYPSQLLCLESETKELDRVGSHYFGFVLEGTAKITRPGLEPLTLGREMYFSSPAPCQVTAQGKVVLWERLGYRGLFLAGGPVESDGRLAYIDMCTKTMIVPPPRLLDPVLNLLCFPSGTEQSMHFHPTVRLGVVFRGSGSCVRPGMPKVELRPGSVFLLPEKSAHCFHTQGESMALIAFHPESDTGPTDQDHPMLNRTYRLG